MKPWMQELIWVRRNDQGVATAFEEQLPKQGDFVPTVPLVSKEKTPYDAKRKDALINTLLRAKERANVYLLYLSANNRDVDDVFDARLALEHIEIALEKLEALIDASTY